MTLRGALRQVAGGLPVSGGRGRWRAPLRRMARRSRAVVAAGLGPVLAASGAVLPAVPPAAVAAGVAVTAAAAATVATAAPAHAQSGQPVLVLLQNGETTAPETTLLQAAGYSVTQATPSTWAGMSAAQFEGYAALVIGDPSSGGSCSSLLPTTGTSGSDAIGTAWQGAVSGNVALLGTAPALPGTAAANSLATDSAEYAAAGWNSAGSGSSTSGTGLYVSLNCEYATAAAGTAVPLLNGVEGIGTSGSLTVQGNLACNDPGTVNTWEAATAATFGGFTSTDLAASAWGTACPVQEAFGSWPAMFTPVAYDAASDVTANFTASDGTAGQPYVLLGTPVSSATAALAPSQGGEVLGGTTSGGTSNPAAPGVDQASAGDPVNTENGDFTQSDTDLSLPGFGPGLSFTRTYDASLAQQETQTQTPGPMGYGWTDNWATSLSTARPAPGDIYAADGLRLDSGDGGQAETSLATNPQGVYWDSTTGDVYFADTGNNRIQEIPASSESKWGINGMTAGDVYTIAGQDDGQEELPLDQGHGNGQPATSIVLNNPRGITMDPGGDLIIADSGFQDVVEIAATSHTQWGISMTAGDAYVIAGVLGYPGQSGLGGPGTSAELTDPVSVHMGQGSGVNDLYIADGTGNRILVMPGENESAEWGQSGSWTSGYLYEVAGDGLTGDCGNGQAATGACLSNPQGVTINGTSMYIADTQNCRIEEVPGSSTSSQWGVGTSMTKGDLYTVAGTSGRCGSDSSGAKAIGDGLSDPTAVRDPNGNLYITDAGNNDVVEVAGSAHSEWETNMTADDLYSIDGWNGPSNLTDLWVDSSGDIYVSVAAWNSVWELVAPNPNDAQMLAGGATGNNGPGTNYLTLADAGDHGAAVNASLRGPTASATDSHGDVYIADAGNDRVQEIAAYAHTQFGISMQPGDTYTVASSAGGAADTSPAVTLADPVGLAVDSSGDVYIADADTCTVDRLDPAGNLSVFAGTDGESGAFSGGGGAAASAVLGSPSAVATDSAGDVFIADSGNNQVLEVPAATTSAMTAGDIYVLAGAAGTLPSGLTVTGTTSSTVSLSWSASSGAVGGYAVYVNGAASPAVTTTGTGTAATVTGLSPSTTYSFTVAALSPAGTPGPQSSPVSGTTAQAPPAAPSGLTVTGSSATSVSLSWTAPSGTVTGYVVYDGTTALPSGGITATITGATATVTGLSASTGYTFTVAAVNAAGTGAQSSSVSVTTSEADPGAPSGLSVTGTTSSSVSLSWTAPSGPVSGYYVYLGGTELPSGGVTVTVTGTTATVSGLSASTAYELSVAAFNGAGTGTQSSQVAATTGVPAAPAGLSVTATTSSSVSLSWTAPPGTVTGYDVYENGSGTALASSAVTFSGATATVTGLSASTGYTFTVAAVNAAGTGAQSSSVSATTAEAVPGAPSGLSVTGTTSSSVSLSWTAPSGPVSGYYVYLGGTELPSGGITVAVSGTTATVSGLSASTAYELSVAAFNGAGTGTQSSQVAATTGVPAAPAGLSVTATTSSSVSLSWTAPPGTVTGYDVYENGSGTALASSAVTFSGATATVTGLSASTGYTFTVAAVNAAGTGAQSSSVSATTANGVPAAPTGLTVTSFSVGTLDKTTVHLSWTAPAGTVTGYDVYVGDAFGTPSISISGTTATVKATPNLGPDLTFAVAAYNTAGTGPESNTVTVNIDDGDVVRASAAAGTPAQASAPPGVPAGLAAAATTSGSTSLSWNGPSGTLTGYYVYENGTEIDTVTGTATKAAIAGLAPATAYIFTVAAYNSAGTGPQSAAASIITTAAASSKAAKATALAGGSGDPSGYAGNGGPATAALLQSPDGLAVDAAGNVYVSDSGNNQVREIAAATGAQHGQAMTAGDIYAVAGNGTTTVTGAACPAFVSTNGDQGPAVCAVLSDPQQVAVDQAGDVYIADSGDSAIREVPAANGAQWSQSMTSGDIYDVAGLDGNPAGDTTGDGASAATTFMAFPYGISTDPYGDLYVLQQGSTGGSILPQLQEITATAALSIPPGTSQTSSLYPLNQAEYSGGGITITQPDSSQVTFDAELPGGGCPTDYSQEDGYCLSGQFPGATLASSSSGWVYTPTPGGDSFTYPLGGGQLTAETDTAGNKLSINYNSPAPGTGSCPSAAASCQTIIAATGRTLVIGSNASGLVTSATDPLGRTWTYAYNSSDQLTSATDPMGNIASYTYGQGSNTNAALANDLLTITGPNAQPGGPDAGDSTVNVYDGYGRVTTQTDPMGWKTIFNYCVNAAAGDCLNPATGTGYVTITDPDGNTTTDGYQAGDLVSETQHTAATLVAENDYYPAAAAGVPWGGTLLDTTTTDGEGDVTSYAYNTYGQQISVTAPSPAGGTGTTTSSYTAQGQDDCDGTVLASSTATCAQDTGPLPVAPGGVITPASSAPPDGLTWTLYDTDGNELYTTTGVYEPGASTASYSRTTYQLFNGNSVTLNGTSISCAAKSPVSSLPCATINADGVVTQLGYDPAGDLTSSATPDGNGSQLAATTYSYDTDGEQTSKTSPDGNLAGANAGNYTTTIAYNADGKQTALTMAGGSGATATPRSTLYSYDSDGNQVKVEDARGYTAVTQYNADDQATMVTTPDGDSTLTCYDGDGNTVQTVLPVGVAVNDLTPASCPTSYPAGYSDRLASDATVTIYNAEGQVTSKTAPAPAGQSGYETTSYTYNADGQPTQISSPPTTNGGTSQVTVDTYGSAGQLASQTTGYGTATAATTSYCYDSEGGTTSVVAPDGNTSGTAPCETSYPWTISATENPTQASYQTIYGYDSAGEPVSTTTPATGAAPGGALITATYDAAGNVLTRTDPDGVITTYTYTPAGQPAAESYSGSAAAPVSYTYDANGAVIAMTDGTGTSTYQYDSFGDLTSAQNGNKQTVGYEFDADGDVTSITYPLPSAATWAKNPYITYGYDNADQLTSVTDFNSNTITITNSADGLPAAQQLGTSGDTITTTYSSTDSASAVTLAGTAGTLQSFSYADAPAGNILTETDTPSSVMSPASYGYDAQGRVTSDAPGSQTADDYALDPSGNLTTLPNGAAGTYNNAGELTAAGLSGSATSYTYSPDGERLTAAQGGTTTDTATWNGAQELTAFDDSAAQMGGATYNGTGLRTSATFTPAGGSAVTQAYVWRGDSLLLDSSNAYIYGHGGTPVEQVNLSTGAVTYLVTDSLGSVRGTVSSSGALTGTTSYDAWGNPQTPAGLAAVTPFGFAGGYTDPDGLIYLIDRYYDPATGQFISVDPDLSQTQQPYEYTGGDPVNATDPTGTSVPSGYGYSGPSLGDPDSFQESTETEESAGQFEQAINAIYELKESDPIAFNATTIAVVQREVLFNDKDSPDGFSTALQTTVYVNGKGNGGFIRTLQRMGLRVRPGDGDEHAETVAEQEADYGFIEDPGLGEGMLWRVRNWFQNRPPCPQCENPATTAANTPVDQGVEMTAEDQGFTTETMGPGGISMVLQEEISPIQSQGLNPAPIVTQWYKYNLLLPADLDGGGSGGGGGGGVGCEDDEC